MTFMTSFLSLRAGKSPTTLHFHGMYKPVLKKIALGVYMWEPSIEALLLHQGTSDNKCEIR